MDLKKEKRTSRIIVNDIQWDTDGVPASKLADFPKG